MNGLFVPREKGIPSFIILPEDPLKGYWDFFITFNLLFACLVTPCRIAFVEVEARPWNIANYVVDFMFLLDIINIFNSAYYDEDFNLVTSRKIIAKEYIAGWFLVDFFAIVLFDQFLEPAKTWMTS